LKLKPVLLGVTTYVPFAKAVKLYAPDASVVVVAVAAPLSATVTAVAPVTEPEMLQVDATTVVKLMPGTFAPFTVTATLAGLNVKPAFVGVTV
jgi:hypothetical protein